MQVEQPLAGYNGKPEIDDGHTKIANELLDAIICHDFTKRQLKILLYIMRKTYGWNKPEDDISRSQIVNDTGLSNPNITTTIQELQAANVLIINNGKHAKNYRINKYYDQWRVINLITITETIPVIETITIIETITDDYQNDNILFLKQDPQKTTPKDNTKDKPIKSTELPTQDLVSEEVWEEFLSIRKKIKAQNTPLAVKSLINKLRKLKEDGQDPEQIVIKSITNSWKDVYPLKGAEAKVKSTFENFAVNKLLGKS